MRRKTSKNKEWRDHYSIQAKKENFPARSVYKLKEIQQKYNLIKKGYRVLDLGCSPGSWLIYAAELTGKKGWVIGVDLKPLSVKIPSNAKVYTADIFSIDDEFYELTGKKFNVILSDMAPATTGNKSVDAARSFNLCEAALLISQKTLMPGGSFVCKIFQGEDFNKFSDSVKAGFKKSRIFKPKSSRKASKEIYIIGLDKN
ncbi:MAG: RlmE family RNA methyltransferase [Desulfobacteraceae bacterium]|nr:RlmE family RNA methyltransferase [Desulfobacteraceae bacterium]MBC2719927.1 RlmE family RNA methyltransferase [Desulfobacteraceae bacterium]